MSIIEYLAEPTVPRWWLYLLSFAFGCVYSMWRGERRRRKCGY